jgi:hypothetical protein
VVGPVRVRVATRWWARRLSEHARASLDRAPVADDSSGVLRTTIVGLDPLRILLFGSGALTGYGVRARKDAVDGQLAQLLADRTGRGAIIESRVRLGLPIGEAVRSLGGAGTATFGVAVWAPRFGEELQHVDTERCRSAIRAMLQQYRAESQVPLIVCHLLTPLGLDWRTTLRRPRIAHFNRILTEEASMVPGVTPAAIGTYRPGAAPDPRAAAAAYGVPWHRGMAEHLAPTVLLALGVPGQPTKTLK